MAEHDASKHPRGTSSSRRRQRSNLGHGNGIGITAPLRAGWSAARARGRALVARARTIWDAPTIQSLRELAMATTQDATVGVGVLVGGMIFLTLLVAAINFVAQAPLPSPGLVYVPLVAMLAYHWGWRHALAAGALELLCVYLFFIEPAPGLKRLDASGLEQLTVLAIVTGFVLALVQLARTRRAMAEREAGRFAALNSIGAALARELDERRLLDLIARTARDLANAEFAAFTLRPRDALGQPLGPAEGHLFHLAAVVGVTPEQEALFKSMPLGGGGLLAPIFHHGVSVRVDDALALQMPAHGGQFGEDAMSRENGEATPRAMMSEVASTHPHTSHGSLPPEDLRALGVPAGHPIVRSFLGAPLLDRSGAVRGGLLLGHSQPGRFTDDDEALLLGLAAQASVALENARLYRAAQTQAQELDAIFESIADGITLMDAYGQVVRENAAAREMHHQLAGEEALSGAIEEVLHAPAEQARHGGRAEGMPVAITDAQGEQRHYLVSAAPLRPPQSEAADQSAAVSGAVVVCHDVTEVHRLDEERRGRAAAEERRALLQTVIDELPSGVYLVRGPDARLVLTNRAAGAVLGAEWAPGVPMGEFLAASGVRVFGTSGTALDTEELATVRIVRTGEAIRHHQEVIRQPNGTSLPVLLNAVALDPSLLRWPDDGTDHPQQTAERAALVVLHDVTALKEAERIKDEFIALAAHELRNPMAAIKGYAQLLTTMTAKGKGAVLADWQAEALETIDSSTSRLVELTDDLLDVTRLQAGRLALRLEPADLVALIHRVLKRLQVTAPQHTLRLETSHEFVVTQMDVQRIEQVLGNLINNAIKYSPDGGEVTLTLREHLDQGTAELAIRDHGIGIPEAQQARIFGRFARADNARARGIGGTGLGLFLCRELVERHGGRIWFESVEGQGSTFYITLPLACETSEADLAGAAPESAVTSDSASVS